MKYDGFISYSHSADGQLAPAVQAGLQRLAKPWYRRRALHVFRDQTGLGVNPHMWNSITHAMDQSRYFVLLTSPEAAASPWVNREISLWLETHSADTLLPVLTDGTLLWSDALGDYDPDASTALPPALVGAFVAEPHYLDLRWAHDETQLDLRHSRFRGEIATLAAPMHGIAREDLEGEDVRLHRRAMRLAGAAGIGLVALTVAALIATFVAVGYAATARDNEARANRNLRQARAQRTLALTNATEARRQKTSAQANADLAEQNQAEAESQQALAEANATEAQNNANEAATNGKQAQRNAAQANNLALDLAGANTRLHNANNALDQNNQALRDESLARAKANASLAEQSQRLKETNRSLADQTLTAVSRQLAATSLNEVDDHYDLSLLEAVTAHRIRPTNEARNALLRSVTAHPEIRVQIRPEGSRTIAILVSPNGDTIATIGQDGIGAAWDAATGKLRRKVKLADPTGLGAPGVLGGAFGPNNKIALVSFSDDGADTRVQVVNTTTGARFEVPNASDHLPYGPIAFSRDGRSLAVATISATGEGQSIDRFALAPTPTLIESVPTGGQVADNLALSPDATTLAWSESELTELGSRTSVVIRHLGDARQVGPLTLQEAPEAWVTALVFSADGHTLESVMTKGPDAVVFWNVDDGARTGGRAIPSGTVVAASPDQRLIAIAADDGIVTFEDARTGAPAGSVHPRVDVSANGTTQAFTPDGQAFVALRPDGAISVFDLQSRSRLGRRQPLALAANDLATLSPDGTRIAVVEGSGRVAILDAATRATVFEGRVPGDILVIPSHAFAPDSDRFAFQVARLGADQMENSLYLVDITEGTVQAVPTASSFSPIAFTPDGILAVTTYDDASSTGALWLWDAATGQRAPRPVVTLPRSISEVAFSSDGTVALTTISITNAAEFRVEVLATDHSLRVVARQATSPRFSSDGKMLAVRGEEGFVLLSMPTGTPIGTPLTSNRQDRFLSAIAFDGHEGLIATASTDGTIQLWDPATTTRIGPALTEQGGFVDAMVFTDSGTLVSVGSPSPAGGTWDVVSWRVDSASLLRTACTLANRDLTQSEWTQLVGDVFPYEPPCAAILGKRDDR